MATGVEMLGQMSEDINLAGPVQGGNMVVKPNEAPVGAAAMLSKQLRNQANKGVAGIYELPEPQDNMPAFMRIAQEGIERQTAGQRNMYPNNFADDEGGILELPRNLRTAPGVPETSLAYITDEEKAILGLLKPGTPHRGPEDVPSYDSLDYVAAPSKPSTSATQSTYDTGQSSYSQSQGSYDPDKFKKQREREQQQDQQGSGQYNTQADIEKAIQDTGARTGIDTDNISNLLSDPKKVKENKEEKLINDIEKAVEDGDAGTIEKLANDAKTMGTDIGSLIKNLSSGAGSVISGIFDFDKSDKKDGKKKNKKSFIEGLLSGGTFGTIMDKISKPTEESFMDNNYKAIMKNKYFDKEGNFKGDTKEERKAMKDDFERFTKEYSDLLPGGMDTGNPNEMKSMKEVIMSGTVPEGSDLERRLDPNEYWKNNKPVSALDFKDMAEAQAQGNLDFTKGNTQAIEEGRRLLARDRGGNQNNRPRFMQETQEEEVVETPDGVIDEEAQTMKYTGPRTGDKEVNVPLNRRFRTDPTKDVAQYRTAPRTEADIYKYMTEGTTGEGIGLEPFSEYQRRRRKAMGLEPLGLYG
jgi:hypothetical protein